MAVKDLRAVGGKTGGGAAKVLRTLKTPRIRVKVTQEILKTACRQNSGHCAVSDAVKLAAPWATHIASDLQSIRMTDPRKGLRYTYLTPRTAQQALIGFDQGKKLPTFEFSLRGGHVATSFKRTTLPNGKVASRPLHYLGKRRLVPEKDHGQDGTHSVPGTVGGRSGVRAGGPLNSGPGRNQHSKKTLKDLDGPMPLGRGTGHPGHRREFGMRAFTGSFKLEDVAHGQLPVGAPSLSDKA